MRTQRKQFWWNNQIVNRIGIYTVTNPIWKGTQAHTNSKQVHTLTNIEINYKLWQIKMYMEQIYSSFFLQFSPAIEQCKYRARSGEHQTEKFPEHVKRNRYRRSVHEAMGENNNELNSVAVCECMALCKHMADSMGTSNLWARVNLVGLRTWSTLKVELRVEWWWEKMWEKIYTVKCMPWSIIWYARL